MPMMAIGSTQTIMPPKGGYRHDCPLHLRGAANPAAAQPVCPANLETEASATGCYWGASPLGTK